MTRKKHGIIIETPTEARQAEPGPSILVLLVISVSVAVVGMAVVWFVFFAPSAVAFNSTDLRSLGRTASQSGPP